MKGVFRVSNAMEKWSIKFRKTKEELYLFKTSWSCPILDFWDFLFIHSDTNLAK